jgi:hypothetical protein
MEWGITTFAASIFEETVASSCRKFYFMSGIFINRERERESVGERAWIKRETSTFTLERDQDRRLITPTKQHNQFSLLWGGGDNKGVGRGQSIIWLDQGMRDRRIFVRFPIRTSGFHPHWILHSGSGVHPASYSVWALSFFPGDGVAGSETDHLHLVTELKSVCACVCRSP